MINVIKMINNIQHFSSLVEATNSKVEIQQEPFKLFLFSLWNLKLKVKYYLSTEVSALG